jgi:hypothetical protein
MNLDLSKVWWCSWAFSGVNNFNPNQKINIEISTSVICQSDDKGHLPRIGDVFIVNQFAHSLFSVHALTSSKGYTMLFHNKAVTVQKGRKIICTTCPNKVGNSYLLRFKVDNAIESPPLLITGLTCCRYCTVKQI